MTHLVECDRCQTLMRSVGSARQVRPDQDHALPKTVYDLCEECYSAFAHFLQGAVDVKAPRRG